MLQFDQATLAVLETAYQGNDVMRRRRKAFDALALKGGESVVDVGCGNGMLTAELARTTGPTGHVIGIDPSDAMLSAARERCAGLEGVSLKLGRANDLPVDDASADAAVAVQVLEYLDDIPGACAEAHRILRPGGRFVAIDTGFPTLDWATDNPERMARMVAAWDQHYVEASVAAHWSQATRRAGFMGADVSAFTYCDTTLRPDGMAHLLMHLMRSYAVQNDLVPQHEADAWFDEQIARAKAGIFFFSISYYLMIAIKV